MGLKESGLRGSLRNVSVGIDAIPDSQGTHQWNHDEGSGTTLGDAIGSLDGSISGATWLTDAGAGDAYLDYDGSDDTTELGTVSQSEFTHFTENAQGTIFAWINPDATDSDRSIFTSGRSSNDVQISFEIASGELQILLGDGSGSYMVNTSGGSVSTDVWQPAAFTCDGSTARLFLGDPISEVASASTSGGTSNDLTAPVEFGNAKFDGGQDLIWTDNVARSQSSLQDFIDSSSEFYE